MRPEDGLAWFGALAAIISVVALGSDGWSAYEIIAAIGVTITAIGLAVRVYWDRIRDLIYDETPDGIRPATERDAEAIYAIATDQFGSTVTDVRQIKSLIRKDKACFFVHESQRDPTTITIEGYACIFPLSAIQVDQIKSRTFEIDCLLPTNIPRGRSNISAVYIGAIVGTRYRSKAKMLGFLEPYAHSLAKKTKTRMVYAKPVTSSGLRLMKKKQFAPVHAQFVGMHNFYEVQASPVPLRRRGKQHRLQLSQLTS